MRLSAGSMIALVMNRHKRGQADLVVRWPLHVTVGGALLGDVVAPGALQAGGDHVDTLADAELVVEVAFEGDPAPSSTMSSIAMMPRKEMRPWSDFLRDIAVSGGIEGRGVAGPDGVERSTMATLCEARARVFISRLAELRSDNAIGCRQKKEPIPLERVLSCRMSKPCREIEQRSRCRAGRMPPAGGQIAAGGTDLEFGRSNTDQVPCQGRESIA